MASITYKKLLPDYGDLDNGTGKCPGYRVYISEKDGSIGLAIQHASEDSGRGKASEVFLNTGEAQELLDGLKNAIDKAKLKNNPQPVRAQNC